MVSRIIVVSKYADNPPVDEDSNRHIAHGPLYATAEVSKIISDADTVRFWTRKCKNDLETNALDQEQVQDLLRTAMANGTYRGSSWCLNSPGGVWAACDEYTVSRKEYHRILRRDAEFEYYMKFAISKSGVVILLVSCHL